MSFYDDVHAEYLRDSYDDPDPRPMGTGEDSHLEMAYEDRFGYPYEEEEYDDDTSTEYDDED